jgi:chromate transporter
VSNDHTKTVADTDMAEENSPAAERPTLFQLGLRFLKIGAIGFGGGMAVIALMEQECVRRHRCVEADEFLHGVGLGQILGPFAVNAALFIGYRMFGFWGAITAVVCFMAPSIVLVIALSWLYFTFHTIPSLQSALSGLGPVVIALILSAAWSMGRKSVRSWTAAIIALVACLANFEHVNPVWILLAAGLIGLTFKFGRNKDLPSQTPSQGGEDISDHSVARALTPTYLLPITDSLSSATEPISGPVPQQVVIPAGFTAATVGLGGLFWTFLKVGLVFFGGGFVLIPILHQHLVTELAWLTQREFLDGVAISQLTPGPVAVLATFAGYRVNGILGALVATVALFVPAVVLMLIISHYYQRFRHASQVRDFLAGVTPAVVGLIASAALLLAPGTISYQKPMSVLVCGLALVMIARWKWHPAFVLMFGAVSGSVLPGLLR